MPSHSPCYNPIICAHKLEMFFAQWFHWPFFSSVYLWPLQIYLGIWWGSWRWRRRQGGWRGALSPVFRSGSTSCLQNAWDRASRWLMKQGVPICGVSVLDLVGVLGPIFRTLSLWRGSPWGWYLTDFFMCKIHYVPWKFCLAYSLSAVRILASYSFMSVICAWFWWHFCCWCCFVVRADKVQLNRLVCLVFLLSFAMLALPLHLPGHLILI